MASDLDVCPLTVSTLAVATLVPEAIKPQFEE